MRISDWSSDVCSSDLHLQSILATVPDAMIIIDETGAITSFSAAAQRLFGYSEAELVGRNVSCLMPQPDRDRHDEYLANYQIGRASCRERVCQYVSISVVAVSFKKKQNTQATYYNILTIINN